LKDGMAHAKRELSAMRQTPLRRLFTRLQTAVEAEARRDLRDVRVLLQGDGETVDRRIADLLIEPCLQIVRNSVAHGIEAPAARLAVGKPPVGTITLAAKRSGHRLVITIQDDGAGVDIAAVRRRAVDIGAVAQALADAADDNTLLALLFLPGFSTRETSDLLAGRGIGLDIALNAIQRMGGALRLTSRLGEGFAASVEVPLESGLASVLWVTAGGADYAVPTANALAVRRGRTAYASTPSLTALDGSLGGGARVPHLAACLEACASDPAPFTLDVVLESEDEPYSIGVDAVGCTEEVLVRPLGPLVATMGPYAGAIVRDDGSLRLAIDVYSLAPRARALGRVPETASAEHVSE
jgi:two-component system chemotaxis sensor kinase CheA